MSGPNRVIRVGAVSFTNTVPLIHTLDRPGSPAVELSLSPPAQLADRLAAGEIEVGLIPVVEHFRSGKYRLITSVGICSRGPVESVNVYCRKPVGEVSTLAADVRSRTSVALAKVWFAHARRRRIKVIETFDPTTGTAARADAVLVIGDANWKFPRTGWVDVIDLGAAWHELTGTGFVYAGWSARPELDESDTAALSQRLTSAKMAGVAAVRELARRAAVGAGVAPERVEHYLTRCIRFDIEEPERRGMELFREWCGGLGLLP